ncbi:MAG: hypothetical protein CEE43_16065 [Promethearchaeota archaeon Loki_b32]|nr:MAG: hypothetical protein CEE43_16065 [Candidatus Lokiarchaeota archaeon Loki_b32]
MNDKKNTIKIWLIFSVLLMILLIFSVFFWDFYSGTDTQGFGVLEPYYDMGMFYIYMKNVLLFYFFSFF